MLRFLFQTLPGTRRLTLLPAEQAGERQPLQVREYVRNLVVIAVVDLGGAFCAARRRMLNAGSS